MRYQSPVASPLAHYWEEEITGFWNSWLRLGANGKKFIYMFIGDTVLANLFLLLNLVSALAAVAATGAVVRNLTKSIGLSNSLKRIIDTAGSIVGLLIGLPIWLMVSILIKLDSEGPVFYTQLRVGRNRRKSDRRRINLDGEERRGSSDRRNSYGFGKPFKIIKFRTMYIDAEKQTGPVWACKGDPRVTRIGRILRMTRIDEIPQLLNVLIGDMSLVGPRPERPFFVEKLDGRVNGYLKRFDVKPGVTGLAQVEHKYDESIKDVDDKVRYDLKYISNLSLIQDLRILVKTVVVVMTARGW
jgi:lipopolysaccharide/colanic/teichoic acid biosynthesis glycosyltransferase